MQTEACALCTLKKNILTANKRALQNLLTLPSEGAQFRNVFG
jgi:hypothetical protein